MSADMTTPVPSVPEPRVHLTDHETDRSIDGFERFSARRALELVKRKLGREGLLELLGEEIDVGERFLRGHLERSDGEEVTGATTLRAHGITAAEFTTWLNAAFAREDVMLAGHPEHYAIHAEAGRYVNIVETLDEYVCSFYMRPWNDSAVRDDVPSDAPVGQPADRRSQMLLADGTVVGSIANEFQEESDGFSVRLSVTLPATCAPRAITQHLEHFAVEFRFWILQAAAELPARQTAGATSAMERKAL